MWQNTFGVGPGTRSFVTSIGCPHRCIFCTSNPGWRRTGRKLYRPIPLARLKHWAYLLGKLKASPEGGGTLLDQMATVFAFEGGHGFDPADGRAVSAHSTENMAMIVAGGAGGLKKGLHIPAPNLHPAQVLLTALRAVGYSSNTLGEVTGEIPGLR